ncbi:MAG: phosphotransferase [Alphaproteobacteria bacterium]|nr:phosphotransferase [Alphaproteobacteria bacterium]
MWRLFFEVFDRLAGLIPNKDVRERIRQKKLYDYRKKFNALRKVIPEHEFKKIRVIKGGWNIGFIINNKYVCKIRKFLDESVPQEKIIREKRITDAFQEILPVKIPKIDVLISDGMTFYKYNFISGVNLNKMSQAKITRNQEKIAKQLARFIHTMHNSNMPELSDLKTSDGDGWNHHDICNNMLIDKKTMKIIGIIDWEYAGWGPLDTEILNCTIFSRKMRNTQIDALIRAEYKKLSNKKS